MRVGVVWEDASTWQGRGQGGIGAGRRSAMAMIVSVSERSEELLKQARRMVGMLLIFAVKQATMMNLHHECRVSLARSVHARACARMRTSPPNYLHLGLATFTILRIPLSPSRASSTNLNQAPAEAIAARPVSLGRWGTVQLLLVAWFGLEMPVVASAAACRSLSAPSA